MLLFSGTLSCGKLCENCTVVVTSGEPTEIWRFYFRRTFFFVLNKQRLIANKTMKLFFANILKRLTHTSKENKSNTTSSKLDIQTVGLLSNLHKSKRKHIILDKTRLQVANDKDAASHENVTKEVHVSKKVDLKQALDSCRHEDKHISKFKKINVRTKPTNSDNIHSSKLESCICCLGFSKPKRERKHKHRSNIKHNIRKTDHVSSCSGIFETITLLSPSLIALNKIPLQKETKIPAPDFKVKDERRIRPNQKHKVSKLSVVQLKKSEQITSKSSRAMNLITTKGKTGRQLLSSTINVNNSVCTDLNHENLIHYITDKKQITESAYCVMNMQVHYDRRRRYKLKPNECEPGVCIPGECDPYECQKRINRRFMKRSSTKSGNTKAHSMSSRTNRIHPNRSCEIKCYHPFSRSQVHQYKQHERKQRIGTKPNGGFLYETLPKTPKSTKQAVRLGSSFSFNIEFSKDKLEPGPNRPVPEYVDHGSNSRRRNPRYASSGTSLYNKHYRAIGTPSKRLRYKDGKSQSSTAMYKNGSISRTNKHKRCFCTLNLNKNLMQHRGINISMKDRIRPEDVTSLTTVGQNTGRKKRPVNVTSFTTVRQGTGRRKRLLPYECEPNVCIPGECDPYECLERINSRKRRYKDFGTRIRLRNSSMSVGTYDKAGKARGVQHRRRPPPERLTQKALPTVTTETRSRPHRQAVRIGSSFSFNVDIFKDKSNDDKYNTYLSQPEPIRQVFPRAKMRKIRKHRRAHSSQDTKIYQNRYGQARSKSREESNKLSFLQRCFCVAKLLNARFRHKSLRRKRSSSFMEKMSNKLFNSHSHTERPLQPAVSSYSGSSTQTDKIRTKYPDNQRIRKLKPYECEPGICVPKQCDPYQCMKYIKKSLSRNHGTSTPLSNSRSSVAGTKRRKTARNRNSQSQIKMKKLKTFNSQGRLRADRPSIPNLTFTNRTNRQAVRIGSNFSFNIEFYKDKSPTTFAHSIAPFVTRDKSIQDYTRYIPQINRGTTSSQASLANRPSQYLHTMFAHQPSQFDGIRTLSRGSGDTNIAKRCFCTLELQNAGMQHRRKIKINPENVSVDTSVVAKRRYRPTLYMNTGTKTRRKQPPLEPDECERGTCVPGLCDSIKCYERIQARYLRSSGIGTERNPLHSACSITKCAGVLSGRSQKPIISSAAAVKKTHQNIVEQPRFPLIHPSNWQGVRIGSNVSLEMEFYKELVPPKNESLYKEENTKTQSRRICERGVCDRNVNTSDRRQVYRRHTNTHHMYKDNRNQARRLTENKASVAGKALKRCFCTSKLHQSRIKYLGKQSVTIGRVEIKQHTPFKPFRCKPEYCDQIPKAQIYKNAGTRTKNKYLDEVLKRKYAPKHSKQQDKKDKNISQIKPETLTIVKMCGNEIDKTVSYEYDKDLEKNVTVVKVAGTDVGMKSCSEIKNKNNTNLNIAPGDTSTRCVKTCSYCKILKDIVIPKKKDDKTTTQQKSFHDICESKKRHFNILQYILGYGHVKKFKKEPENPYKNVKQSSRKKKDDLPHNDTQYISSIDTAIISKKLSQKPFSERESLHSNLKCANTSTNHKLFISVGTTTLYNKYTDQIPDKKVRFDINNEKKTCLGKIKCKFSSGDVCQEGEGKRSQISQKKEKDMDICHELTMLCKRQSFIVNCIKRLLHRKQFAPVPKDPNYTEVKIRGSRLRKDICVPNDPKSNTLVTVSGSYVACEVSKMTEGDSGDYCRETCKPCKETKVILNNIKNNEKGDKRKSRRKLCVCSKCDSKRSGNKLYGIRLMVNDEKCIPEPPKSQKGLTKKQTQLQKQGLTTKQTDSHKELLRKKSKPEKKKKQCTCGSSICHKLPHNKPKAMVPKKLCICGSVECKQRFNRQTNKAATKLKEKKKRQKLKIRKAKIKEEMWRRRKYACEDKIRQLKRDRQRARMLKEAKNGPPNDLVRLTESVFDIGSVGLSITRDAARSVVRNIQNPYTAQQNAASIIRSPPKLCAAVKKVAVYSGIIDALRRIAVRLAHANIVHSFVETMESHAATNYIIHPCNRKKRMKGLKRIKKKEPLDFGCSPYMASLRRRPCFCIYFRCAWFYPHFISLLRLWQQFTDVVLFLLAVVVWSPCLVTIEVLRFFVCCCLCTA